MRNIVGLAFLICLAFTVKGQSIVKGLVTDRHGNPIGYATVSLKGAGGGTITDSTGKYKFVTDLKGRITVLVSSIGFDSDSTDLDLEAGKEYLHDFVMKEASGSLGDVVIIAGSFQANNDRKVVVLRPMDIYTTAGGGGDIVGALRTLPGIQRVGDQTGLFVRGGDGSESANIVDGLVIQNGFSSSVPGIAQRSRFSPYQFKGISFSSGGYSSRYGDALSGILELNTNDLPEKTTLSANINEGGIAASGAKLYRNSGVEGTLSYTDLQPFYGTAKTNFNFYKPPVGFSGSAKYTWTNDNNDILKISANGSNTKSGTDVLNPKQPDTTLAYDLNNTYGIGNLYYKHNVDEKTFTTLAGSYSGNEDVVSWGGLPYDKKDSRAQGRAEITSKRSRRFSGTFGIEFQHYSVRQTYDSVTYDYKETQTALYTEAEWKPFRRVGIKAGARYEYSALLNTGSLAPRLAAAVKVSRSSQFSVAGGMFYQDAADKYLLVGDRPKLQRADHYIANYQYSTEDRTFRVEGYYKSYEKLVRELEGAYDPNPYRIITSPVDNSGNGYAKGIDVFWRDKASIKNLDYWISYSYIDTKRLYENFPTKATPPFIANNNLNVVGKYAIGSAGFNLSATWSYASGRRYYNPTAVNFLSDKAPDYQNLALTVNYLFTAKRLFGVIYVSTDNLTNQKNVLGYLYSTPGDQKYPVVPAMYRSVFAGIMLSLSQFKKEDL